jgi:hypothetical protein
VAVGLDAIRLDAGHPGLMGWQDFVIVAVCAWEHELWWNDADRGFVDEHREILDRLDVERAAAGPRVQLRWTEPQARAFQLLHILPHELGHHHDQMTTLSRRDAARGEPYAERYAHQALEALWPHHATTFAL